MNSINDTQQQIIVSRADVQSWNESLESFQYSLFQLKEWVDSVSDSKRKPFFLNLFYKDELVGKICGVISNEKPLLGKLMYCFSGPAYKYPKNEELYKNCLEALVYYAKSKKYSRVYIDFWDSQWREPVYSELYKTIEWHEYVLELLNGEKYEIRSKDIRRKVRTAQSAGVEFGISFNSEMVGKLFEFMEYTRFFRLKKNRKSYNLINVPYVTRSSLEKLLLSKKAICHFAHQNGDIHYISLSLLNNGRVYGLLNGADEIGYTLSLPASSISGIFNDEVSYLNFGASVEDRQDNLNLDVFKRKMGAVPHSVYVFRSNYLKQPQKILYSMYSFIRALLR